MKLFLSHRTQLAALAGLGLLLSLISAPILAQDINDKLTFARTQHEIILLLIKQNRLEEVQPELDKILHLQLPPSQESRVISSMLIISEAFLQNQRDDLCLKMLEKGISSVQVDRNKSKLLQEMGYVYRLRGDDKKAMDCFRKAQQLGLSNP